MCDSWCIKIQIENVSPLYKSKNFSLIYFSVGNSTESGGVQGQTETGVGRGMSIVENNGITHTKGTNTYTFVYVSNIRMKGDSMFLQYIRDKTLNEKGKFSHTK